MSQHFLKKYIVASMTSFMMIGAVHATVQAEETEVNDTPDVQSDGTSDTTTEQPESAPVEPNIDIGEGSEPPQSEGTQIDETEPDEVETEQQSSVDVVDPAGNDTTEQTKPQAEVEQTPPTQTQGNKNEKPASGTSSSDSPIHGGVANTSAPATQYPNGGTTHPNHSLLTSPAATHLNSGFKYNPLALERFEQISAKGNVSASALQSLEQKATFKNNLFLNRVQQDSDYFRFQAFSPLATRAYYKNLDKQVLGLISGDVGTMPDLKKKANKAVASRQQEDKEQQIEQEQTHMVTGHVQRDKDQNETSKNSVYKWLICALVALLLAGALYRLVNRREG